ncbi:hypothetical protein [Actinomycetospora termitidis]|uniref:Uncharacterized protein n=1 Tax=Actinomycetospora termitidis TaxID=3053470 RepID=A0ABT7MF56_9PSEU|nr:hypothetical protein [Actinomycetospora sp. Odt1-22]MDL5159275.1 hypothetical protein [Actinomycetospora sp. Odt1-22]
MYRVEPVDEEIAAAIDELPERFLVTFTELRVALEVAPWSVGGPYHPANPPGSRSATFGPDDRGLVVFAVKDSDRHVLWLWSVLVAPD